MDIESVVVALTPTTRVFGRELYDGYPPHPINARSAWAYREAVVDRRHYIEALYIQRVSEDWIARHPRV